MANYNIFSKRQKKERSEIIDVYQYDKLPQPLKVQIIQIIEDTIGSPAPTNKQTNIFQCTNAADDIYKYIHKILSREYGVFSLKGNAYNDFYALTDFFLGETNVEKGMDFIELSMQAIEGYVANNPLKFIRITSQKPEDAIVELNERFKEHSVGYQYESGVIIRVDSQLVHSDVIKPTLHFLGEEPFFKGANDEFITAHEHYRHKRYKECLNDCLKSFESLMKAIHDKHHWQYSVNDTASKLINSCLSHYLVPSYLQSQFTSLKTILETGVATIRNKNSSHGQGTDIKDVPEEMASYMLHLTATNLLFLSKCEQNINGVLNKTK